ncbi:MAG TPA: MCP four helix bundle domain-containing protein, partial [Candidatus Wallbacteria bacterium]|nr:MCP four helix bundle domain-containing protein [Candidatus Wallbacteria bacterium]
MISKMKLGMKLMLSMFAMMLVIIMISRAGYKGIGDAAKYYNVIVDVKMPGIEALMTIKEGRSSVIIGERAIIYNKFMADSKIREAQAKWIEGAFDRIDKAWKKYEPLPQTELGKRIWPKFVDEYKIWKEKHLQLIKIADERN